MTEISKKLKQAGLKVTVPRLRILEMLEQNTGHHASAEDIYKMLIGMHQEIGVATIYRVLTQCAEAGLVRRLQFEGGRAVFELACSDHHDHMVCVRCGRVHEFNDQVIESRQKDIADRFGFDIEDHTMVLYGLCGRCGEQTTTATPST